jgi:hypothetical protein
MKLRSVTARGITGAVAAAMLATSATPAMADGYRGGGWNGGWGHGNRGHRDHDRIGAGGVIAGIAVLGLIAAIASSGGKSKSHYSGGDQGNAADACAATAEQRLGSDARVTNIDQVVRAYDGYQVSGIIETRNYGGNDQQRFTCQVRYGNVERIDFSGGYDRGY